MKKLLVAILFLSPSAAALPAWAQTKLTPETTATKTAATKTAATKTAATKTAGSHLDNCAPIGRTANGELVYSMKCDNIPAPPAPPPAPQAEVKEAPPPEPEARGSGLFGWSYDRRPDQ